MIEESPMPIRVCLAGATGWAGSPLARGIGGTEGIELVSAVARSHAGRVLGDVLGDARLVCPVFATVEEALAVPCDVFFDYTRPAVAKRHTLAAVDRGVNAVIGTSGLTDEDYEEIAAAAERRGRAVLAVGNFALTVVLLLKLAEMAAMYIPQWEIVDYASDAKRDAPSGTTRELAARLSRIRAPKLTVPIGQTEGRPDSRGATVAGSQVHSLRLPGYTISAEVIFGMPDQRLSIRHDAGPSAEPYVEGALLAIRKVGSFVGLRRGLDSVMDLG
jgi:4-hydroxy-tetrahydrodipicolinate reductase